MHFSVIKQIILNTIHIHNRVLVITYYSPDFLVLLESLIPLCQQSLLVLRRSDHLGVDLNSAGIKHIADGLQDPGLLQPAGLGEAARPRPPGDGLHLETRERLTGDHLLAKLQLLAELPVKVDTHPVSVPGKPEGRLVAVW